MIRTQLQLDEDMYEAVRRLAVEQRRSIAACVREALAAYLSEAETAADDLSDIAGKFTPLPSNDVKPHDRDWASAALGDGGRE